ncbi:DUF2911 domain-containing protein [Jejuia spongiicola]|uniref:DUF2911 domain-containing protein n=1 Tax=Jejuia spongiicola TaxID=2942207 RepID=A0ABT0QGG6_9FLAO|nr:DUF2911 domain-containing protein [Jejuia spongiicola]MCL6296082.1 DUF2911 domain-containing protein [Jejuia spongiicola]PIA80324.1 hypothetical protein BFR04_16795 [Gaetbulibacter sp. 4G1]
MTNYFMTKKNFYLVMALFISMTSFGQFHTLNFPKASPKVVESQKLGVTKITINYSSPSLRGRDVWSNPNIIPQKGKPFPWRAGADMATTINFTTDVTIEGKLLKAGTYAFYVIPENDMYTLLFAHNYNQWGSYYLNIDEDVSLKVMVKSIACEKSEQLDFEFLNRTENGLMIGLEWGEKRIPFKVEVDLNKTVVESFRSELRGINTYHWQAWNDAARWCLNHNTNLEEALVWVNHSINGGYGGFAAHKDIRNLVTKINLLVKLNKVEDLDETINDASEIIKQDWEASYFAQVLNVNKLYGRALDFSNMHLKDFSKTWSIHLNKGVSHYFLGNQKEAIKAAEKSLSLAPDVRKNRIKQIISEFKSKSYKIPVG